MPEDKFFMLQESIKKFGIIKPLIVNGDNNVLTAGHQRTRAIKSLGIRTAPVIKINGIKIQDEIKFNLFHNSIETNKSKVTISGGNLPLGYSVINCHDINYAQNENATIVAEIGRLILRYGEWGSIVADQNGNVILNSDYAVAARQLNVDVICYTVKNDQAEELKKYLSIEYGEYNYDALGVKSYNQLYCQMRRLSKNPNAKKMNKSSLYENYVLPRIDKSMRIIDFGAGLCGYANMLKNNGYAIFPYEPNYQTKTNNIDITAVVKMIHEIESDVKSNGLFDVVVLDSVLNSVVSTEVENFVIAVCNSLLKSTGTLYISTRNLGAAQSKMNFSKSNTAKNRNIEFFDKENFTATFRNGVWTMQHFHDFNTLKTLLAPYFNSVETFVTKTGSNIYAVCKLPKSIDMDFVKKALEFEFNMEYPNNYRHNQHTELVKAIIKELEVRNK